MRRTTGGRSNAPGTRTSSRPDLRAPRATSASTAPATRRSTTDSLKRDATSAIRRSPTRRSPSTMRIASTPRVYQARQRSLFVSGDLEAECGDAEKLARRRQHAHAADAEVAQDLRTDSVGAQHRAGRRIHAVLVRARADDVFGRLLGTQHDDDAVRLARDPGKRRRERPARVLTADADEVARRVPDMYPHEWRLRARLAAHERDMQPAVHTIHVPAHAERPGAGLDHAVGDALDRALLAEPVAYEVGDRADGETVLRGEALEVGPPCHRAVVVQHLDDHRGRLESCEPREVAARFGVAGPRQHATRPRH